MSKQLLALVMLVATSRAAYDIAFTWPTWNSDTETVPWISSNEFDEIRLAPNSNCYRIDAPFGPDLLYLRSPLMGGEKSALPYAIGLYRVVGDKYPGCSKNNLQQIILPHDELDTQQVADIEASEITLWKPLDPPADIPNGARLPYEQKVIDDMDLQPGEYAVRDGNYWEKGDEEITIHYVDDDIYQLDRMEDGRPTQDDVEEDVDNYSWFFTDPTYETLYTKEQWAEYGYDFDTITAELKENREKVLAERKAAKDQSGGGHVAGSRTDRVDNNEDTTEPASLMSKTLKKEGLPDDSLFDLSKGNKGRDADFI